MSESLIKTVFSIIGTLLVSLILFTMIFTQTGQGFIWRAVEPMMLDQWRQSTMDNGAGRTVIYEEQFEILKQFEYSRNVNTGVGS